MIRELLEPVFESIAAAMQRAAAECNSTIASQEAERHGLIKMGDGSPSARHHWERREGTWRISFMWRWYDQSKAFSIQPDMNIMSVTLHDGSSTLCSVEERYED